MGQIFFDFEFDDKKKEQTNNRDIFDFGGNGTTSGITLQNNKQNSNNSGIKLSSVTQDLLGSTTSNKPNNNHQFSKGFGVVNNTKSVNLLEFNEPIKEKVDTKSVLNQIDLSLLCSPNTSNIPNQNIQNQNPNSAQFQQKFQNWPDFNKDQMPNTKKEISQNKNIAFEF